MGLPGATLYAYPWDVSSRTSAAQLAGLGFDDVTLAAAYHSVRAATPRRADRRVIDAPAGVYFPVRDDAWGASRLRPVDAAEQAGSHSFSCARDLLTGSGVRTRAWVVVTHVDGAGARAPDLCVTNAFDEIYGYALCPSQPEVVRYAATLVAEAGRGAGVESMIIEACGPLGVAHQSTHEKTAGADWSATDQGLLSICFCRACVSAYGNADIDVQRLRILVRHGVGTGAPCVPDVLDDAADAVLAVRREATAAVRDAAEEAARSAGVTDLAFFAAPEPWATGPNTSLDALVGGASGGSHHSGSSGRAGRFVPDAVVVDAWAHGAASQDRVRRTVDLTSRLTPERTPMLSPVRTGAYTTLLPPSPADATSLLAHWRSLVAAGADELHIYHGGLASQSRLDAAAEALAALRDSPLVNETPPVRSSADLSSDRLPDFSSDPAQEPAS